MRYFNKAWRKIVRLENTGACEGTLTCSTCHLIFPKDIYNSLPNKPTDEELDMLDLAYELTDTYVIKILNEDSLFLLLWSRNIFYADKRL